MDDNERMNEIERRITELERKHIGVPIKPEPGQWGQPPTVPAVNPRCPKCGIELAPVMGYVCPQPYCPTGMGGTMCAVAGNGEDLAKVFPAGGPLIGG